MENEITTNYKNWIKELKLRYRNAQIKASIFVNRELLTFYFELGKDIIEKQFQNTYGSGFYKTLSHDLQAEIPDAKGFSPTNLKYAFYFYELYSPILQQVVAKCETQKAVQIRQQLADDFKIYQRILDDLMRIKTERDNPTLGILVCKNKDNIFAKFALESSSEPLAISEYELNKLYPENFKSSMPTIEELEEGLAIYN